MQIPNMMYTFLGIMVVTTGFLVFADAVGGLYSPVSTDQIVLFNNSGNLTSQITTMQSGLSDSTISSIPVLGTAYEAVVGISNMIKGLSSLLSVFNNFGEAVTASIPGIGIFNTLAGFAFTIWITWEIIAWLRGFKS